MKNNYIINTGSKPTIFLDGYLPMIALGLDRMNQTAGVNTWCDTNFPWF